MSHDIYLTSNSNYCSHCKRSDSEQLDEYNVSYNHCWIWYEQFDKERGFVAMYDVPLVELVPQLEKLKAKMIFLNGCEPKKSDTQVDSKTTRTIDNKVVTDDGWARTMFNAYRCVTHILEVSKYYLQEHPQATWYGD